MIVSRVSKNIMSAMEASGAISRGTINNKFLDFLFRIHTSRKINRICKLPFLGLWDKILFRDLSPEEQIYFIIEEGHLISYRKPYLAHLRKKYKHCRIIYFFRNPMSGTFEFLGDLWERVKDVYDAGMTFNRSDAQKYGLLFTDYWPCLLPDKTYEPENQSDVYFVGLAKDRLDKILSVYEKLSSAGLICDFHIMGVPEDQQKYSDAISYNVPVHYDENLQRVKNTKCVLEILPFSQNYSSLRVCEALWYRKKLLTTNQEAPLEWFYNPSIVQVFRNADDIDTDFIRSPADPKIYDNMNIGDFNIFAEWLMKNVPV